MAVFFLYTGLEVTVGQWAFTVLTEARGVSAGVAGTWAGAYWGMIGVGRVAFGVVVPRFGTDRLLRLGLLMSLAGAGLLAAPLPPAAAFLGLMLLGFGLAPVYPGLMTRTPQRLGPALSAHAVGFQVGAAMIGAAAVPGGLGLVASGYGLEAVPAGAVVLAAVVWGLHEVLLRTGAAGNGIVTVEPKP
jgi:fucose permease